MKQKGEVLVENEKVVQMNEIVITYNYSKEKESS